MSSKSVDQSTHDPEYDSLRNQARRSIVKFFMKDRISTNKFNLQEFMLHLRVLQHQHKLCVSLVPGFKYGGAPILTSFTIGIHYYKNPSMATDPCRVPSSKTRLLVEIRAFCENLTAQNSFNGTIPDDIVLDDVAYVEILNSVNPDRSKKFFSWEDDEACTITYSKYNTTHHRVMYPAQCTLDLQTNAPIEQHYTYNGAVYVKSTDTEYSKLPREMKAFEYSIRTGDVI